MNINFKLKNRSLEKRKLASEKVRKKYPDRIPVIVQKDGRVSFSSRWLKGWFSKKDDENKDSKETKTYLKFLVPSDVTFGQFAFICRKKISHLKPEDALFFSVRDKILPGSSNLTMSQVYKEEKDEDGFLYLTYQTENTFGKKKFGSTILDCSQTS